MRAAVAYRSFPCIFEENNIKNGYPDSADLGRGSVTRQIDGYAVARHLTRWTHTRCGNRIYARVGRLTCADRSPVRAGRARLQARPILSLLRCVRSAGRPVWTPAGRRDRGASALLKTRARTATHVCWRMRRLMG